MFRHYIAILRERVPSAFWEMLSWAVDRILWMGVLCLVSWCVHHATKFVGFSRIFLLGILIFKGLTAQRLYKSFGVKGLNMVQQSDRLLTAKPRVQSQGWPCEICRRQSDTGVVSFPVRRFSPISKPTPPALRVRHVSSGGWIVVPLGTTAPDQVTPRKENNMLKWPSLMNVSTWDCALWFPRTSITRFLDHTQRRATIGRTPLEEWSARRRPLPNTHNRQTFMSPVGFEPTIAVGERP
jgi:hypothetical protein